MVATRNGLDVNRFLPATLFFVLFTANAGVRFSQADEYNDKVESLSPVRKRSASDLEKLTAQAMVMDARILQRQGKTTEAIRKFQRAWRLDTEATTILKQVLPLALELGRVDEATRYALLLADSDLEDPFLAERLAMLMSNQLDYDRSLQLYQRVLELRTKDPDARNPIAMQYEMGRLYFLTEKYVQASQAFRVVLEALENENENAFSDAFRKAILKDPKPVYGLFAESFLESSDYDLAEQMFKKTNELEPNQQWLTFQLARVDYRRGRYDDARTKLQDYVGQKLRFGGETPYKLLQDMMDRAGGQPKDVDETNDPPSAFVRFRDWLADDPDNFPLLSYVAEMTRRQGVLNEAIELYEKSIEQQPTLDAYKQLLSLYKEIGDSDKLLDLLTSIIRDTNDFRGVEEEIAAIATDKELTSRLWSIGRQRLETETAKATLPRDLIVACGLLALEAKAYSQADEFLGKIREKENRTDLYITWGLELLADEQYEKAAQTFRVGLEQKKNADQEAILRYYLSGALQLQGETKAALRQANHVAATATHIPEFALRPAWILYNAGELEKAEESYSKWLDKHAENYSIPGLREVVREARLVISSICVELNKPQKGIEWLEKILDEFPQDSSAMNDLGYLMVDENTSIERATKMIRFALEQDPDNYMYLDSLGWALFRAGKYEAAIVELRKASSEETPDPIILDHLAEALQSSGDVDAAHETWERALTLIEDDEELREKINTKLHTKVAESK